MHKPDPRLGFGNRQVDGFDYVRGMRLAVHLRGFGGLLVFLFLVEEENNVGNVGNVAQSEKSPQKSQ